MLLSLLRLIHWQGRRPLVALLAFVYAWAFVALDITHTHATAPPSVHHSARASIAAVPGDLILTQAVAGTSDAPCPVCAAVHATAVALVQAPVPPRALAPARLLVVRPLSNAPIRSSPTLHLRGPPPA